ncbi:MAG TPA: ABC transporter substrate-binding protein, partial [Actinomycetota bacterium]|nr:ABC transporter substrate-binding protein [Actinomycetota bacterium]
LHVRRAVAFAIDRDELLRAMSSDRKMRPWFGADQPVIATHIVPDSVEDDLLVDYDLYPATQERARREMALSRYDRNRDGACDAPECRSVLGIARDDAFGSAAAEEVAASLDAIGIDLRVEVMSSDRFYGRLHDERAKVPLSMGLRYGWDYPNASTVFLPGFAASSIRGGINASLVGAAPAQLRRWGYEVTEVPNVDDRIGRCMAVVGVDQTECWADLDRFLMEDVVPWIPYAAGLQTYVVSGRVAAYSYSPSAFGLALDRMALAPGSE